MDFKTTRIKQISVLFLSLILSSSFTQTLYPLQMRTARYLSTGGGIGVVCLTAGLYIHERLKEKSENKDKKKKFEIIKDDFIAAGASLLAGVGSGCLFYWSLYELTPLARYKHAEQQMKQAKEAFDNVQSDSLVRSSFNPLADDNSRRNCIKEHYSDDDLSLISARTHLQNLRREIDIVEGQLKQVSSELRKISEDGEDGQQLRENCNKLIQEKQRMVEQADQLKRKIGKMVTLVKGDDDYLKQVKIDEKRRAAAERNEVERRKARAEQDKANAQWAKVSEERERNRIELERNNIELEKLHRSR